MIKFSIWLPIYLFCVSWDNFVTGQIFLRTVHVFFLYFRFIFILIILTKCPKIFVFQIVLFVLKPEQFLCVSVAREVEIFLENLIYQIINKSSADCLKSDLSHCTDCCSDSQNQILSGLNNSKVQHNSTGKF